MKPTLLLLLLPFLPTHASPLVASPPSLKMSCSSLVIDRLDPLVNPGQSPTPHLHQIVGGNSFSPSMPPTSDPASLSTCTTCTFTDDLSNYWTAVLFFRARNGTYKRVRQLGALFHEEARGGGMTIYYFPHEQNYTGMVAFKQGFRMQVGSPQAKEGTKGVDYTCLLRTDTRYTNRSVTFPERPCKEGILTTIYFPPCWDGVNLDSADHRSHVAWPEGQGEEWTAGPRGKCPESHPVKVPQVVLEVRWDTREFNDPAEWPEDGSQPFVWSFGDDLGYGSHGDYLFGWKGEELQRAFERTNCGNQLCGLRTQTIREANECVGRRVVREEVDGWLERLPGQVD